MRRRRLFAGLAAAAAPLPALTASPLILRGASALAGDRFEADGLIYQLADIRAPARHDLRRDAEPYFNAARDALSDLLAGRSISAAEAGPATRWGVRRVRAVLDGDAAPLAARLLERGAARIAPYTDDDARLDVLFAAERAARDQRLGLWALDAYRVRASDDAERAIGTFALVEGRIVAAAKTRARVYLNFGADYRTDFTASAPSRDAARWAARGLDLAALEGARIRVRGFVSRINGPAIEVLHPRQIERLD